MWKFEQLAVRIALKDECGDAVTYQEPKKST